MTRTSWTILLGILAAGLGRAAPIDALIIDGQNNHDWKSTTPALKKILEDGGLFQVEVLTTPPKGGDFSAFKPEFAKYRVVISNYNEFPSGSKWPAEVQGGCRKCGCTRPTSCTRRCAARVRT